MKKLFLLLLPFALLSCERQYHIKAQVTFQNGQKDTLYYSYWSLDEMEVYIDRGDVTVFHCGTIASGARSFKLLEP